MEWLNDVTRKWSLKKSFMLYIVLSVFLGYIVSNVFFILISKIEEYNMSKLLISIERDREVFFKYNENYTSIINTVISSRIFSYIKLLRVPLTYIVIYILGFTLFYKHKLEKPIKNLSSKEKSVIYNEDELSEVCKKVYEKIENINIEKIKLKNEKFENDKIISTLSHDIRNSISVLKGNIELLGMIDDNNKDMKKDVIKGAEKSIKRIENFIYRLDKKEGLGTYSLVYNEIYLEELTDNLKKIVEYIPTEKEILLNSESQKYKVEIDVDLILEAFENIFINALRFSKNEINIKIKREEKYLEISVIDDGDGFSKESLEKSKYQYYSEDLAFGNMGIGLYVANEVAKKHGGKLEIRNLELGSEVTLKVPIKKL